jgi:hypothetical protein
MFSEQNISSIEINFLNEWSGVVLTYIMFIGLAFSPGESSLNYTLWDERKKTLAHNVFIKPLNYVQATE